jgi:N-acetylmuramoyl-L-alanine amidase CwlA
MTVKKNIDLLPKGHHNRPGYGMKPKGLLVHTTNNWSYGAGDEAHAEYMENTGNVVSWHATVDEDSWTQHLPFNENGWHAGDGGNGYYNRNWIGQEIACENIARGQKLDKATYENAVEVAAIIMMENGLTEWGQLQFHNVVYGKNCPHDTLLDRNQFKQDVFKKLAELTKKPAAAPKQVIGGDGYVYTVERGDTLSQIAAAFKTSVSKLAELNNIKDVSLIVPGQKIVTSSYLHVVQKGDTLTEIAEHYKTSVDYLVRLNDIENPNVIAVGQRIKLQGTAPEPKKKEPVKKAPVKHNIPTKTLRKGDKGQAVIDLQEALKDHNPQFNPGKIDGAYGPKTTDAVMRYQKYYGVRPYDGIYGNKTEANLKKTYRG